MNQVAEKLRPVRSSPRSRAPILHLRVENGGLRACDGEVAARPVGPTGDDRRWETRAVRALNVTVAGIGLVVSAPVLLLIAILVKLSSRGPVLYTQNRVGLDRRRGVPTLAQRSQRVQDHGGRIFRIYKFRTMRAAASTDPQVWASEDDPRITAVGAILRKYRLDELPQLWNVIKGDMNIVGPRPEQPEIFKSLREQVDAYPRRQCVLPGITGLAQVSHHYDRCVDDVRTKVRYDLEYIDRRSFVEDLRIMARTLPVMVGRKGAL